jgi:hypothetical protein
MQHTVDREGYSGIKRFRGWIGNRPKEAKWLVAVNAYGETEWWWLDSAEAILELSRYYRTHYGFVGDELPHVAIELANNVLGPISI